MNIEINFRKALNKQQSHQTSLGASISAILTVKSIQQYIKLKMERSKRIPTRLIGRDLDPKRIQIQRHDIQQIISISQIEYLNPTRLNTTGLNSTGLNQTRLNQTLLPRTIHSNRTKSIENRIQRLNLTKTRPNQPTLSNPSQNQSLYKRIVIIKYLTKNSQAVTVINK